MQINHVLAKINEPYRVVTVCSRPVDLGSILVLQYKGIPHYFQVREIETTGGSNPFNILTATEVGTYTFQNHPVSTFQILQCQLDEVWDPQIINKYKEER